MSERDATRNELINVWRLNMGIAQRADRVKSLLVGTIPKNIWTVHLEFQVVQFVNECNLLISSRIRVRPEEVDRCTSTSGILQGRTTEKTWLNRKPVPNPVMMASSTRTNS